MPNVKLIIEYDGSTFCGWQLQADRESVQGALHSAIETALRQKIRHIQSAGRTDAGVHARGQVVHFHVDGEADLYKLRLAVSSILRGRVSVLDAQFVPDSFHALNSVLSKCYTYRILQRAVPEALERGYVWRVSYPLDVERMRSEAQALVGTHDFSSFRASDCGAYTPIKRIDSIEVVATAGGLIEISIVGGGFLRNMVRIIIGTLVDMSSPDGALRTTSLREILEKRDRAAAGPTAPAHGLYLMWVKYDP